MFALAAACRGPADPPDRDDRATGAPDAAPRLTLASENPDGAWVAELSASAGEGTVSASVNFSGPADKTRRMGMCLVQQHGSPAGAVTCGTPEDCGSAPENLDPGGARYCVASHGSSTRTCHFRPGPGDAYCVGTPAIGFVPIAPGDHRLDIKAPAGTQWLALVCFEGCAEIPPLTSPALSVR